MSYTRTKIADDKRKNKPNIVFPIINTFIALCAIGFVLYLFFTSNGAFPVSLLVFCLIILILYPIASWGNSYFVKKMNLKRIDVYEKETEILVKYSKRYTNYKAYTLYKEVMAEFNIEKTNEINEEPVSFNKETCSFIVPQNINNLITFGVSFAGLEVNRETGYIIGLAGMMPRSIWYPKKLNVPASERAKIKVEFVGPKIEQKVVIHALKQEDIYYDKIEGWLCVGERKVTVIDKAYEISKDVILVLRDNEIMSLWIKVGIEQGI